MSIKVYRFPNGARLYTGRKAGKPFANAVPHWSPVQCNVDVSRKEAAQALWHNRKHVVRSHIPA